MERLLAAVRSVARLQRVQWPPAPAGLVPHMSRPCHASRCLRAGAMSSANADLLKRYTAVQAKHSAARQAGACREPSLQRTSQPRSRPHHLRPRVCMRALCSAPTARRSRSLIQPAGSATGAGAGAAAGSGAGQASGDASTGTPAAAATGAAGSRAGRAVSSAAPSGGGS